MVLPKAAAVKRSGGGTSTHHRPRHPHQPRHRPRSTRRPIRKTRRGSGDHDDGNSRSARALSGSGRREAYIVVALLTGARTEEMRALTWDHVYLHGDPKTDPPTPPYMAVWRSVRSGGDTKTRKSRCPLALPTRCVDVLWQH